MDRNIKFSKIVENCLGNRKVMFLPLLFVSTFMMVGYAALDREAPVIQTERVEVLYGEELNCDLIDVVDNRDSRSAITVEADTKYFNNKRLGTYYVNVMATDSEFSINDDLATVATDGYVVNVGVNEDCNIDRYVKALDNVDGDVSAFIEVDQALNTSVLGSQIIELSVSDSSGNTSHKTIEFYVTDMEKPVITYLDGSSVVVDYGSTFNALDYVSITDNFDKDIESRVELSEPVNTNSMYEKDITISVKDSSDNVTEAPLHVKIADISAPEISFSTSSLSVSVGASVDVSQYVSAYDNYDGNVTNKIKVGIVDTSSWGNKYVDVTVTDAAGNTASRTFTVYVKPPANIGAAEIAKTKVGCAYVYGGTGPNAFDCCGFTQWVYRQMGINIPRSISGQWNRGTPVSFSDIQPGDILFYNTHGGLSHVGIYVGNGQMVHAGTVSTGVQYTNIYMGYWTSRYMGARRIG